jgi:hypothetical protein
MNTIELAKDIIQYAKSTSIPDEYLNSLLAFSDSGEPNLAIKRALDYVSDGILVLPERLKSPIYEWGKNASKPYYRDAIKRAFEGVVIQHSFHSNLQVA